MTASTGELTAEEQQAVDFFLEYQESVRHALRYPKDLKKAEEWSRFLVFLRNLDSALCKSSLDRSRLLYRGVEKGYAERLLFLLDIQAGKKSDFIPHILQDPSYISSPLRLHRPSTGAREEETPLWSLCTRQNLTTMVWSLARHRTKSSCPGTPAGSPPVTRLTGRV